MSRRQDDGGERDQHHQETIVMVMLETLLLGLAMTTFLVAKVWYEIQSSRHQDQGR